MSKSRASKMNGYKAQLSKQKNDIYKGIELKKKGNK